ncbi:MAG: chromosome segregation protein SMC, partial [Candidatus Omnitrophota bacterium]
NYDLIPGINSYVKEYARLQKVNIKAAKRGCPKIAAYYENTCEPSRAGIREVVAAVEGNNEENDISQSAKRLMLFAESDIYWDEITEIKKIFGEEWVYDLEIEKTHNYIADEFIVHNSNVIDAVKWVLGEQSAKSLRGSCMEDVIFNGTEQKEQLGYAEVSLTLSNESKFLPIEYDEVTISRRLYRSGESEYLINKNPVRLRDVNELLMGSGIGTSAYSIIEQGKIDQILSANPEERRIVFEEASGITRYKSKKREAVRKLEYTDQNLLRVNDIIKEVERQINSIERQARKAQRYQEMFDRLKDLDTKLAAYKYKEIKDKSEGFDAESKEIKKNESELGELIAGLDRALDEERSNKEGLDARIFQYGTDYRDTGTVLERAKDRLALGKERLQELYKNESDQKSEIESLARRVEGLSKAMEAVTAKLVSICEDTRSKEGLLASKETELTALKTEIDKKNEAIKGSKARSVDILSNQSRLKNEIAKVTSDLQNVSARLRRLSSEKENVTREVNALSDELSGTRLSVNMTISNIETLESERVAFQNNLKKETDGYDILDKSINDSKNYILSLHSKLSLLEDLIKRHEGFTGGTQALLNGLSSGQLEPGGFCEPLAELLEPRRGYEAICESALNGNMQTIIVDEWQTAFAALDFLEKNGLGKASFMKNGNPDSSFSETVVNDQLIVGRLIDFIRFDARFEALFKKLLNGVFLVENINDGILVMKSLSEDLQGKVRIVTKKGDIITKGKITGGSAACDFTSSIIGRQRRMNDIEGHIAESEKELLKLKQELMLKRELIEACQAKVKGAEDAVRAEEIVLTQKKSQEGNLLNMFKKIQEEVDLLNIEIEESLISKRELKESETKVSVQLETSNNEELSVQLLIMDSQNFIEEGAKRKEEYIIGITQIQTELESLKREEDEALKGAEAQKSYYEEQQKMQEDKTEYLKLTVNRQEEVKGEIERLETEINSLTERYDALGRELKVLEDEGSGLKVIISEKERELDEKKMDHDSIKDRVHKLEMEKTQLSFQMETLRSKIDQIYKVNIEETLPDLTEMGDLQAVQAEVDDLSARVEKMGPVNLVAIDEHKELQERYAFLKRQEEDLVNAKDSLHKAIRKINQTTKELFMDTFTSIQSEFKNYFKFLFGGGKADIVLLDESDVLESGIEIIVRPPGKKLQAISLLSGGEKALTAIALLFAIFKCKPSPFCLLDEIDAPLDETNIGRFSKALQEFAMTSQFVIITHNKKTMNISDLMYGVTMESSGVSKIISVKFSGRSEEEQEVFAVA